jgi:hypothetical protein
MNRPEFLRHKLKLIAENGAFGDEKGARDFAARWESQIANPSSDVANSYRTVEEELNNVLRMAVFPSAKRKTIKEELTKKFGTYSLGTSNEQVMKKVLKRGKIENEDEFYVVKELVSFIADDDDVTPEQQLKLDKIMTDYEQGK